MLQLEEVSNLNIIFDEIHGHTAWYGNITGLNAEKLLRPWRHIPFMYLLRKGEHSDEDLVNYYVTFVGADHSIRHQPFTVKVTAEGIYYENYVPYAPTTSTQIDDMLYLIMHCDKHACVPLVNAATSCM